MRKSFTITLTFLALLLSTTALAAPPNQAETAWQNFQKEPSTVTNKPLPTPSTKHVPIAIETNDGTYQHPTTPAQAKEHIQDTPIKQTAPSTKPSKPQDKIVAVKDPEKTVPVETADAKKAIIDKTPHPVTPKPAPKPSLVKKPPMTKQFMRTPQNYDFEHIDNQYGGYAIDIPKAFGPDLLNNLPNTQGPMLVRGSNNLLMCAITMLDAIDTISFKNNQPLPTYLNKKVLWQWQHGSGLIWHCVLSTHDDFHGDKLILEAQTTVGAKTYQMLFIMPDAQYATYLPQALFSLNSFKLVSQQNTSL